MTTTTRPPPPPDPIDAVEAELARGREANARLRDADDFNEPTGRFDVQPVFQVHLPQPSIPDVEAAHRHNGPAAVVIALGTLAAAGMAIAHALGVL